MPTILRTGKLRIVIYLNDHSPPHVHVIGPESEAKIELGRGQSKPRLSRNDGLSAKEVAAALAAIDESAYLLMEKWESLHGDGKLD